MESVLRGMQWERAVLYLDDIIIFKDVATHMERIQEFFQRLQEANLKLKPSKCQFFKEQVEFLGHVVSKDGVATDPKKIEAVKEWRTPRNVKEVRSWLGMTGYYRRFMKSYAEIAISKCKDLSSWGNCSAIQGGKLSMRGCVQIIPA